MNQFNYILDVYCSQIRAFDDIANVKGVDLFLVNENFQESRTTSKIHECFLHM